MSRHAVVYLRQSSLAQVKQNTVSRRLQQAVGGRSTSGYASIHGRLAAGPMLSWLSGLRLLVRRINVIGEISV